MPDITDIQAQWPPRPETKAGEHVEWINGEPKIVADPELTTKKAWDAAHASLAPDMVNHPPHYTSHPAGIECIEVIEHASDLRLGTAIKYIWRVLWGSKGRDVEDIEKAVWYLNRWLAEKKTNTITTPTLKEKTP